MVSAGELFAWNGRHVCARPQQRLAFDRGLDAELFLLKSDDGFFDFVAIDTPES